MNPDWSLTPANFERLLCTIHPDRDRAAVEYEILRLKITKLLEWRGCLAPEEFADRVFDRLAQRLEGGEKIERIYGYCCGIARMLLLESQRHDERQSDAYRQFLDYSQDPAAAPDCAIPMHIFERCLDRLSETARRMVLDYYQFRRTAKIDTRKDLADRLGVPMNALRLRVHRIRETLRKCVERNPSALADTQS